MIDEACAARASLKQACLAIELSVRTLQRWREQGDIKDDVRAGTAQQRVPAYRMTEAEQLASRGKSRTPAHQRPEPFHATAANQLWSWDITYLATTVKGRFFYLYLIMDVFSRKIVGWEGYECESAEYAHRSCARPICARG